MPFSKEMGKIWWALVWLMVNKAKNTMPPRAEMERNDEISWDGMKFASLIIVEIKLITRHAS